MKCCAKWSNLDNKIDVDIIHKTTRGAEEHFFSNDRFKYCPECGSKLENVFKKCIKGFHEHKPESEYCECECSVRLKHDLRKDDCLTCHKPIKPKRDPNICEHCGGEIAIRNPKGYCDHLYYPENCEVCKDKHKPKRDLPEKWYVSDDEGFNVARQVIAVMRKQDEIIEYLK